MLETLFEWLEPLMDLPPVDPLASDSPMSQTKAVLKGNLVYFSLSLYLSLSSLSLSALSLSLSLSPNNTLPKHKQRRAVYLN